MSYDGTKIRGSLGCVEELVKLWDGKIRFFISYKSVADGEMLVGLTMSSARHYKAAADNIEIVYPKKVYFASWNSHCKVLCREYKSLQISISKKYKIFWNRINQPSVRRVPLS